MCFTCIFLKKCLFFCDRMVVTIKKNIVKNNGVTIENIAENNGVTIKKNIAENGKKGEVAYCC